MKNSKRWKLDCETLSIETPTPSDKLLLGKYKKVIETRIVTVTKTYSRFIKINGQMKKEKKIIEETIETPVLMKRLVKSYLEKPIAFMPSTV